MSSSSSPGPVRHRPVLPPTGVLPVDLLPKLTTPRKPGRPIKITAAQPYTPPNGYKIYAGRLVRTKSSLSTAGSGISDVASQASSSTDRPPDSAGDGDRPSTPADDALALSGFPIAGVNPTLDRWVAAFREGSHRTTSITRSVGLQPRLSSSAIQTYDPAAVTSVTTYSSFLGKVRTDLGPDANYVAQTRSVKDLVALFDEMVSLLAVCSSSSASRLPVSRTQNQPTCKGTVHRRTRFSSRRHSSSPVDR